MITFPRRPRPKTHVDVQGLQPFRLFVEGLKKYGRGDWKSISKYCVVTRTASQVSSHAQKFFMRYGFNVGNKRSSIYDATIMDDEKLVNPQRQPDDLKDTEQIVVNSRTANAGYGGVEVHDYPILESFGNHSNVYQNGGTFSTLKRPRSKRGIGAPRRVGLTSGMVGGADDVSFVADQNLNHHHGISVSSQGPRPEEILETRCRKTLPAQEPVLAPVVSTVDAPNSSGSGSCSGSGSSVPLTDKFGASSYDFYATDFMDLKDLELYF